MSEQQYIHGYNEKEQQRLLDQSDFLELMIYDKIDFSNCNHVLEIGCGVGAHLKILLTKYSDLKVTGMDIDASQIEAAKENLTNSGFEGRFELIVGDASKVKLNQENLPDGALFVWVLEHVNRPIEILTNVRKQLQPNSPIYLTEVYNNGWFIQPELPNLQKYWKAFNEGQLAAGGDIVAGVKLGYHLKAAGFNSIDVRQISQFHDLRHPERRTIMANYLYNLMMSGSEQLLKSNLISQSTVDGLADEFEQLSTRDDAIIFYPGFQASARS